MIRILMLMCWPVIVFHATSVCAAESASHIDFERDIRPILSSKCLKCHGPDDPEADLDLTRRESAVNSGAIQPHQANAGTLLERVTTNDESLRMPPEGEPLTAAEIDTLRQWIASGANWPGHWAYRPLADSTPAPLQSAQLQNWCRTTIDQFIAARLQENNLTPSAQADRLTLIRRASFDLRGLPPTPEEVDQFLNDPSDDAWAQCVDRMLASPAYGERWARHWMDLVHFAETHGHDQDRPREHAWPYRDYLIRSFNNDKPYDVFVREQIAGDVIDPLNPDAVTATGFLAAGPWDESSLRDIREDSIDRLIGQYLDRDDILTTVMSTFASTSIHCARCHNHKFDPITQSQYYGMQAIFAGIDKANRPYDDDMATARQRADLQQQLQELQQQFTTDPASLLTDAALDQAVAWETTSPAATARWRPLTIGDAVSQGAATLTVDAADFSVLASGPRPDKDVYVVEVSSDLPNITAIRLEVLAHDELPMQGPGRQDNGNLHLNEIRCFQSVDGQPNVSREIRFAQPFADFDQAGWTIAMAVDGNPNTAWGIFPQVGVSHQAVLPFQQPVRSDSAVRLRVELHQIHGGGHLIGSFRLSATDAPADQLAHLAQVPPQINTILNIPRADRSTQQQAALVRWIQQDALERQLNALPPQTLVYAGTNKFTADGSFRPAESPRTIHVLNRGLVSQPGDVAVPAPLSLISGLNSQPDITDASDEGTRRVMLADWLADRDNPLVWRTIVNRVWQHCIGRALVTTPNDFGQMGAAPSHPQLLDWLALELQRNNGSLKALQRLILTSAVYQQQSTSRPDAAQLDAGNQLLWRMNRRRLDAESYRDALLQVSGTLDNTMGGPSVRQFIQTPGTHVTPNVDYLNFDPDDPANNRRSVYRFLFRTIPDPFMEAMDCPDASQLTPRRNVSLTAMQALATLNDKQVIRLSRKFAESLTAAQPDIDGQIQLAYRRLFGRLPADSEHQAVREYAVQYGLDNACRFLFNTNEFLFVD
jgi:hypothetical protein